MQMVEVVGIEPTVARAGRFTVSCHTITAAPPDLYSQAPRDANLGVRCFLSTAAAVISGPVPGRLGPNSVDVSTRYLYRCLTIQTKNALPLRR
jgi:hypothetical protein